jgi:hypothetical protein
MRAKAQELTGNTSPGINYALPNQFLTENRKSIVGASSIQRLIGRGKSVGWCPLALNSHKPTPAQVAITHVHIT